MSGALTPLVLTLHHTPARLALAPTAVGAGGMRRVLVALLAAGYRFVGIDACGPQGPPRGSACLTVDDGYASNARFLAPILRELGIPWCVFVLVGRMGRSNAWDLPLVGPRDRHLDGVEVRQLAKEGVTIGSHAMRHEDLRTLGDAELAASLRRSREALEDATGRTVQALSYPRGRLDARVAKAAARAGYRIGFAGARAPALPAPLARLAIPRGGVYSPDQVPGVFRWTVLAGPGLLSRARSALAVAGDALILAALASRGRPNA